VGPKLPSKAARGGPCLLGHHGKPLRRSPSRAAKAGSPSRPPMTAKNGHADSCDSLSDRYARTTASLRCGGGRRRAPPALMIGSIMAWLRTAWPGVSFKFGIRRLRVDDSGGRAVSVSLRRAEDLDAARAGAGPQRMVTVGLGCAGAGGSGSGGGGALQVTDAGVRRLSRAAQAAAAAALGGGPSPPLGPGSGGGGTTFAAWCVAAAPGRRARDHWHGRSGRLGSPGCLS
jgi:hypothetical protein